MTDTIGFIGLGQIGAPIARHLLAWPGGLVVCDLQTAVTDEFAAKGAAVAASPNAIAEAASVISVMVRDDDQVAQVTRELIDTAREGTVVALHSTIRPDTAVTLAAEAASRGIAVIDAPVSGGVLGAHAAKLAVMVGGTVEAFERCKAPFGCFAELIVRVGPVGAGTRAKLARNLIQLAAFCAATEGERLAEAAGIDLRALAAITRHSDGITGGPSAIMVRDSTGPLGPDDPLRPIFEHTRDLGEKDLSLALELANELGVELALTRVALAEFAAGLGVARSVSAT